jgi:cell wall-associated NlpC family hydrolase
MDKLKKGDLVFFIRSYETHHFITHSGIYLGDNKFIHTSSKKGVTITSLSDTWWKERYIFGTRVLE